MLGTPWQWRVNARKSGQGGCPQNFARYEEDVLCLYQGGIYDLGFLEAQKLRLEFPVTASYIT